VGLRNGFAGGLMLAALVLSGCGGAPAPTPAGTPAVTIHVTAYNLAFDPSRVSVPADVTFAIEFENRDAAPHNIVINGSGINRTTEAFTGPQTRTYVFAALPAGTYTFVCAIHPEMTGVLESTASSDAAP
jgi:plastocyanin